MITTGIAAHSIATHGSPPQVPAIGRRRHP